MSKKKTEQEVAEDRESRRQSTKRRVDEKKYQLLLDQIERLEREKQAWCSLGQGETVVIKPHHGSNTSEAVAVVVASDWHIEEEVKKSSVNGLNEYNLVIAEKRVKDFFRGALRLWQIMRRDVKINTILLYLGGDFVSGNIHEELLETCAVPPIEAAMLAESWLASGIEFLLKNTPCELILPCSAGNHSRITARQRHSTEYGNSLETFIYHSLARRFKSKRTKFIIEDGYHTYLQVYDLTLRLHHGHGFRYQGGVGGIYIPFNKAIAQWNKAKHADLDVVGH